MSGVPLLTLLTLTPLVGAVIIPALPSGCRGLARGLALAFSLVGLGLTAFGVSAFDRGSGEYQWVERHAWVPGLGVNYYLGVDGLGLTMVLLAALLVPFSLAVWVPNDDRVRLYCSLVLLLQAGLFGAFTALNFFHWFLFWELSLIPAFFLIRLWGGPERSGAATQFFVYTMVGSITLLLAFLALNHATGEFDFPVLARLAANGDLEAAVGEKLAGSGWSSGEVMTLVFIGVLLGFAIKVPLMPFHTWLPAAYAEAPSAVTMLLTGALSKMGVYGLLRILLPIFPDQLRVCQSPLLALSVLTVVGGAAAALAQRDLKRLLAYSSVNHLGYCLLAVFAVASATGPERGTADRIAALNGTVLQMFNHGVTAAALFGFVALLEQRSAGGRALDQFGGLRRAAPVFTGLMGISIFSSLGLPGLNGFVGEFLVFKGVFGLSPWVAAVSVLGLLLTAVLLLTVVQRVFHGPLAERWSQFPDLTTRERWVMAPAIGLMFALGVWPQALVGLFNRTVTGWVERMPL